MTYLHKGVAALLITAMSGTSITPALAEAPRPLKAEAAANVDAQAKNIQVMVDTVFSFAEPGFQEVRTSAYLADVLEKNGFKVERGVAGIPTAFVATWGSGGPLIALGSDIDCLLGLSQVPGIAEQKPLVPGAPGHGEGHNSGMPLMIAAAIAAKEVMEKNHIPGRLMLWPGVAEELLATKAYYVRAGLFKDVDASIFAHVSSDFGTAYGELGMNGMVSVEYTFHGKTAHAGGMPWEGRSALDGVELMDTAWNFRREHLPVTQRSHYVITNGGGQPNIVPDTASVWYYFRDRTFAGVNAVRNRQRDRGGGGPRLRHQGDAADPRLCRTQFRQQAAGRGRLCQHHRCRHAEMDSRRPGLRQSGAADQRPQGRTASQHPQPDQHPRKSHIRVRWWVG